MIDPGLLFRAVDAFADLAEALALAGPLVIGLDDLQWADSPSLLTLGAVARRIAGLPAAVIGCLRPLPRSADLDRVTGVLEAAGARRIWLAPLAAGAVRDLVADAVAAEPGPALLAGAAGAGGNPLFVTELVGALLQDGTVRVAGGRAEVTHATLPPTLRLTILRRLSLLPEPAVQALRAASILGPGFSLTDLATITGGSALQLSVALAGAVRAGVVDDDGTRLRFRHDLIRDAIYEDRGTQHGPADRRQCRRAGRPQPGQAGPQISGALGARADPHRAGPARGGQVHAAGKHAALGGTRRPAAPAPRSGVPRLRAVHRRGLGRGPRPGPGRAGAGRGDRGNLRPRYWPGRAVTDPAAPQRPARRPRRRRGRRGRAVRHRPAVPQWARALILEADGQAGQAYAVLAGCWDWCARQGLALEYRMLGPDLIRLALATGDPQRARAAAAAVAGLAGQNQVPSLAAAALRCRGLADDDAGTLAAAAQAYQDGTRPLELAGACEDAGAAFARQGDPDRARPLLEQALTIYEQLDAGRNLARAEAALRQAGIRRGRRGPRGQAAVRLAQPHPGRAGRREPGRRRADQPADRRPPVHLAADRADPPGPRVRQARHRLPRPARRPGHPPPPVGTVTGTGRIG